MSGGRISRWVKAGRLHRLYPAVYAYGRPQISERGELIAALLYAGRGAALSHLIGSWWVGLIRTKPPTLDVCAPGDRRPVPGLTIHHPAVIERRFHDGLPVLATPSLLLQIAATQPLDVTRKALAEADYRKLLHAEAVSDALGQGIEGSAALRRALRSHLPQLARCQNDFEAEFLFLCERFGVDMPEVNVRVGRFRPDMLWRHERLIVELDGRDAHTRPAQVARDRARDMALRELGHTVLRYTWAQVRFDAGRVAGDLGDQLAHARRAESSGVAVEHRT